MCHTDIGCFNSFNWENQGIALAFILFHCLCSVQSLLTQAIQTEGIIKQNVFYSSMPINKPNMSTQPWSWGVNLIQKGQEEKISFTNLTIYWSRDGKILYPICFMDCGFFYPILIYACHDSSIHMLSRFPKVKNCYGNMLLLTKTLFINLLFLERK